MSTLQKSFFKLICKALQTIDLGKDDKLPANIVFETGNIERWAGRCVYTRSYL